MPRLGRTYHQGLLYLWSRTLVGPFSADTFWNRMNRRKAEFQFHYRFLEDDV